MRKWPRSKAAPENKTSATAGRDTPNPRRVQSTAEQVVALRHLVWGCCVLTYDANRKICAVSESQRFPVAAHTLAYLAHKGAFGPGDAVPSAVLAASMPTNPVVVRRITAMLGRAGLIGARPGASGGAWLLKRPEEITLDQVLRAVDGCAQLGAPPPGARGCPVGERIPRAVAKAIEAADMALTQRLSKITVADLLAEPESAKAA